MEMMGASRPPFGDLSASAILRRQSRLHASNASECIFLACSCLRKMPTTKKTTLFLAVWFENGNRIAGKQVIKQGRGVEPVAAPKDANSAFLD